MPNKEQSAEECDATGFYNSNAAWPMTKLILNPDEINILQANPKPKEYAETLLLNIG